MLVAGVDDFTYSIALLVQASCDICGTDYKSSKSILSLTSYLEILDNAYLANLS